MKTKEILLLTALSLTTAGCDPCARLSRRCPPPEAVTDSVHVHDTVVRTRTVTDTALFLRAVRERASDRAAEGDTARAETSYAKASAWFDGIGVRLLLRNKDSIPANVPLVHDKESAAREVSRVRIVRQTVTVYRTRPLVAAAAWAGLAVLVIAIGKGILRLFLRR